MSAVDTPHLILFEFFIKIQALLQEPFVFRLVCTFLVCALVCACMCVCVHASTCACLQRLYRHLFSLKCNILSIPLPLCAHSYVCLFSFFSCVFCNLEIWKKSSRGFQALGWSSSCKQPLSSSVFCAGDPDTALNAGQCRLPTKPGERGGGGALCA